MTYSQQMKGRYGYDFEAEHLGEDMGNAILISNRSSDLKQNIVPDLNLDTKEPQDQSGTI